MDNRYRTSIGKLAKDFLRAFIGLVAAYPAGMTGRAGFDTPGCQVVHLEHVGLLGSGGLCDVLISFLAFGG